MKKVLISALALCVAACAATPAVAATSEQIELCKSYGEAARATMDARQAGVSFVTMYGIAEEKGGSMKNSLKLMVKQAFDEPRYETQEYIQRAIEDFGSEWEQSCIRVSEKQGKRK